MLRCDLKFTISFNQRLKTQKVNFVQDEQLEKLFKRFSTVGTTSKYAVQAQEEILNQDEAHNIPRWPIKRAVLPTRELPVINANKLLFEKLFH